MTDRKPPGMSFESWVDRQIREAAERGAFENLPGAGKPIPDLGQPQNDNWWIRGYLRKEGLPSDVLLPPSLRLARDAERLPATLADLRTEDEVRAAIRKLNARIASYVRAPSAPQVQVRPADEDAAVDRWRAAQAPAPAEREPEKPAERPRWWRRISAP
jgi:hypothetical protein